MLHYERLQHLVEFCSTNTWQVITENFKELSIEEGRIISFDTDSGQSNRLFIIIAAAMIALICVGLMGLGVVIFLTQSNEAQETVAMPPPATPIPPTVTPISTPSATPTETPLPTPTSTSVLNQAGEQESPTVDDTEGLTETLITDSNATPTDAQLLQTPVNTATLVATSTPTPTEQSPTATTAPAATSSPTLVAQMPKSGGVLPANGDGVLIWAGLGLLLLLVLGVAGHLRSSSPGS